MLILALILIPIFGALIVFALGGQNQLRSKQLALAVALLELVVFGFILKEFNTSGNLLFQKEWLPDFGISFKFSIDGISVLLLGLSTLLVPLVILSTFKIAYEKSNLLYALILLTEAALVGVFMAGDLFLFYFFFEIALIPVYFLGLIWGQADAAKATFKMLAYTIFGSLLMLVGLVYLYSKGQTADIEALKASMAFIPAGVQSTLFCLFMLAFAIKMPIFPLHTWQADAYSESSTPATMLLAGLLSKMGVYGLLRIALPMSPLGAKEMGYMVMVLGVVGLIYGSIVAVKQDNLKRLIAYSSFAHMGLMAAAIFSGTIEGTQGAVFQMLAHGLNSVGLFFVVKIISERTGSRSLSSLGGLSQDAPWLSVTFMIILLGSVALPLTNGFVGEFLMLKGVFDHGKLLGILAGISIILGAVYLLRLFQKTMFGEKQNADVVIEDISGSETIVLCVISGSVILMGVFPNCILKISEPASQQILDYMAQF